MAPDPPSPRTSKDAAAPHGGKLVWFVRHAEALHNASGDSSVRDPGLTKTGREQALALAASGALRVDAQLVVASPMRRTLETASLALPAHVAPHARRVACSLVQEIGTSNADTGRPPHELRAEAAAADALDAAQFDLTELEEMWYVKPAPWCKARQIALADGAAALAARRRAFVRWLRARPEQRIVVVTHHGFVCHLLATELANCEVLAVELLADADGADADAPARWAAQPCNEAAARLPIVGQDGRARSHKGSAPLSAAPATIAKHYGQHVLRASKARAGVGAARGWRRLSQPGLLLLQTATVSAMLTFALWKLVRK